MVNDLPTPPDVALTTSSAILTGLAGLEPTTYGLGNRRSIQLSYSPPLINYALRHDGVESRGGNRNRTSAKAEEFY